MTEKLTMTPSIDRLKINVGPTKLSLSDETVLSAEKRLYDGTRVIIPPEIEKTLIEAARNGMFIIAYGSHKSHSEGRFVGKATRIIREKINKFLPNEDQVTGFAMPIAASISSGHQGPEVKKACELFMGRAADEDQLYTEDYVRKKDEEEYKMKPNAFSFGRAMVKRIRAGCGIAVLPEASVQGGRIDENGNIYGLQPFEKGTMKRMIEFAIEMGKIPVLVPLGISNSHKIFAPGRKYDENKPNLKPEEYRVPTTTGIRALFSFLPHHIVDIKVGELTYLNELINEHGELFSNDEIDLILERKLAKALPPNERGQYGGKHFEMRSANLTKSEF